MQLRIPDDNEIRQTTETSLQVSIGTHQSNIRALQKGIEQEQAHINLLQNMIRRRRELAAEETAV